MSSQEPFNPAIGAGPGSGPRTPGTTGDAATLAAVEWSARQYVAFEAERTRPVRDLLAALPPAMPVRRAIDIGCGPGNSTEVLAGRFPGAAISGIDASRDMIAAARARLPGFAFEVRDIERWAYEQPMRTAPPHAGTADETPPEAAASITAAPDVILANAVLQWLPDHERLVPALIGKLAPGGCLAFQVPDNFDEPAHRSMRDGAADGPWAPALAAVSGRAPIAAAAWYFASLRAAGCRADIWRTTYFHVLEGGPAALVEWFKGSGLRPYLAALDPEARAAFLARYQAALAEAYPALPDGKVLLPFPRLFVVALRE